MTNEELSELVTALHRFAMLQAGQIAALRTVSSAVMGAVGINIPPLVDQISDNIIELAPFERNNLDEMSVEIFENTLAGFHEELTAIKRGLGKRGT